MKLTLIVVAALVLGSSKPDDFCNVPKNRPAPQLHTKQIA